ncbi:chemotaxis response regulator CheY [Neisseria bacilliformis ATCC BAA-1200]|uniref:Chemotaxis response regulator CheY n=1 Tax=Neisseria bacilliformis ATCC BAA-1200 TaxID=888742 RepID=F2B967_9NEIS|nr:chemotaxis response regulator CheY [Neisseria bacilliformis ATCC BAA-1200]
MKTVFGCAEAVLLDGLLPFQSCLRFLRMPNLRQGVSPRGDARGLCRTTNPCLSQNRNRVRGLRHTPYLLMQTAEAV